MYFHSIRFNGYNLAMNYLLISCVLLSSFAFLAYSVSYFISPNMKSEFERFELKKFGIFVIILEALGALGLLAGLFLKPLLLFSAGGLAVLMFLGVIVRIKSKDGLMVSLPAFFFMSLNAYIFYLGSTM